MRRRVGARGIVIALLASLLLMVPLDGILTTTAGQPFRYESWPLYIKLLMY